MQMLTERIRKNKRCAAKRALCFATYHLISVTQQLEADGRSLIIPFLPRLALTVSFFFYQRAAPGLDPMGT